MSEWQKMEGAPKDGTPVLLLGSYENNPVPQVGFWYELEKGWCLDDGENCTIRLNPTGAAWKVYEPTHWMPLPTPPSES